MSELIEQGVAKGLIAFDADHKNITYKIQNKRFRLSDLSKDFGFNIADFKQLRLADTHAIGQAVKKQIAIFYGLPE